MRTKIKAVPHHLRQTLRSLATQAAIPKTTLIRHMKASTRLKARSNHVYSMLTDANKRARLAPGGAVTIEPQSVSGDIYCEKMLNEVVLAIQAKFPSATLANGVKIQQDNASPHRCVTTELLEANGAKRKAPGKREPCTYEYKYAVVESYDATHENNRKAIVNTRPKGCGTTLTAADEELVKNWVLELRGDGTPVTRLVVHLKPLEVTIDGGIEFGFTASPT
ncbi:hypothetical protein ACHHYP_20528 [Achlya hypogyna]|uniref:Uncharacterized protein n=1 Tax=Achlya hypogyna TaxID=1202772 RepID=A0A1V9YJL6_ACHHY|nr:hypothetical protein ACHHYP_20528 [Achlya hypogyna]